MSQRSRARTPRSEPVLSWRERRVLLAVARGLSTQQIGAELGRNVHTLRSQVKQILRKLGAGNRAEAVARCVLEADEQDLRWLRERFSGGVR